MFVFFLQQARRLQNIVPVCVRQLLEFEGDEFKIFGLPTQIVSVFREIVVYVNPKLSCINFISWLLLVY